MPRDQNRYTSRPEFPEEENLQKDGSTEHPVDPDLLHDLERVHHVLDYVESVCGQDTAYQMAWVLQENRKLEVRQMTGNSYTYNHNTQEQYVQCILDLPAKQAMESTQWNEDQLQEAVQHEANRMCFRFNLEIQDRILGQISNRQPIVRLAQESGMSEEIVSMVDARGQVKETWTNGHLIQDNPVYGRIQAAAHMCVIEHGLAGAIRGSDEDMVRELLERIDGPEEMKDRAIRAMSYAKPEVLEALNQALETAAQWQDSVIQDGALDYHAQYSDLDFLPSNRARMQWLAATGQTDSRRHMAGDCATRSLNEVTGGQDYPDLWAQMTAASQVAYPGKDADAGVKYHHFRDIYEEHGMVQALDTQEEHRGNPMRQHLDMREIPALLGEIFNKPDEPLSFIAMSEGHSVAVVDGDVHDSWDSRDMGDRRWERNGRLVGLWVKTDDPEAVQAVQDLLQRYQEVRRYDDVLTYGQMRRHAPPSPETVQNLIDWKRTT